MGSVDLAGLRERLARASSGLEGVTERRMFGCDAFFARGNIYGLVWREGRIGLRLPDDEVYERLLAIQGAEAWRPGGTRMKHWVLLPLAMHEAAVARWTREAHALAEAQGARAMSHEAPAARRKEIKGAPARAPERAPARKEAAGRALAKPERAARPKEAPPPAPKVATRVVKPVR